MRVLGVDFGSKRIGIAMGDTDAGIATARNPIIPSGGLAKDAAAIAKLAVREEVHEIVLGTPVNIADSRMARVCEQLADNLRHLGWTVHLVDESLTSVEAEKTLTASGLKVKAIKDGRDGEAARLILERFFHEMA